ncbi:MAG: DUF2254 family protein, partial [Actinomycetota bacterium]
LLVLRETRTLGEGNRLVPHLSVLLAVALGVLSLTAVVVSVDRLTKSLRVGSVAGSITEQTLEMVHARGEPLKLERPDLRPSAIADERSSASIPADAEPVTSDGGGWVQQIAIGSILAAVPEGSVVHLPAGVGTHVVPGGPLAYVQPAPDDDCTERIRASIALGPERTMQNDIGYGILQLVDIALRALSPGINDPNTANDVIVNLGVVLLAVWEYPEEQPVHREDGRSLVRRPLNHADFLSATFDPLRRYGSSDASVVETMIRVLTTLRSEAERRGLPGPLDPIDETISAVLDEFDRHDPAAIDRRLVQRLLTPDDDG